ncbi:MULTISPECIES: hypothetical protein [Pseudomonas]|jgi:hypothetical protein|uniref:hypothetical protein n=1 Tax=Pseudomonas TaxID=286 RepID=UPI00025FF949|nr:MULTISPECIES: hypothetical protein [Pseudomonas]EIK66358.1 hypothetical protein PflQ8_3522 [Pseudomonas fluorescens Q8r1-96]KAB0524585.1 hypothetical protein F7R20_17830 [Pseudomonas brassicacearum subsp. brassicacearum]NJP62909.1 hypothetical protein [Pseudomonas brassicacearum]QEO79454.1 hypothetical protein ELZ14_18505 [Pseudomonas brassicacearum]ROM90526.1 hypothetical protein BK656_24755 [Pseudomonas brassicacearum]
MKLKREARTLKSKAIASLRRGLEVFNGHDDHGRTEAVLLHLQHSSEMLTKALLVQKSKEVFDKQKGLAIGLDKALNVATSSGFISAAQAGSIRALDTMRNAAQHWMIVVPEDALFVTTRALITTLDEVLAQHFADTLANNLPLRVMPLSTTALPSFDILVDREFRHIAELLAPNKRARDEARGRIRTLLAMEAHTSEIVEVSERDINRIEKAIKAGNQVEQVFPRLVALSSQITGEGPTLRVHFSKKDGAPVRYVSGDDPEAAGAIREVDLQKKYHLSPSVLAERVGLNPSKCKALREMLRVDEDQANMMVFEFGSQKHPRFSDNALRILLENNTPEQVETAWQARRRRGR